MAYSVRLVLTSPTASYTLNTELHSVRIGRSSNCEFSVPKEDLSREHCLFESTSEGFFITDLDSKNGIVVDRNRIPQNVRTKVTLESSIVLSNLYELKINRFDIKARPDERAKAVEADGATTTFGFQEEVKK